MSNSSNVFTPVTDAEALYGEGDWRSVLSSEVRANWKFYMIGKPSIEHKLRGVYLPSFDFTLSLSDQSFSSSIGACWTNQPQKGLERHFAPNAFAIPLLMYPYLGEKNEHWLSPTNRKNMIGNDVMDMSDADDAFDDLNRWVRRNKAFTQSKKDFLLKAPSLKEDAPVPGRVARYVAMCECRDRESDWHLAVIAYTPTAHSYVIEQMRWLHQDKQAPRDPNWPTYMLGDVTNPNSAVEWHVDKRQLDPKDTQDTNVICFTERREFLDDPQKVRKVSPETVAKRFLMVDPASWCIPTYEEQVEFMLSDYDPAVTADMIRAACAHRCGFEIPSSRPERVRVAADESEQTDRRGDRAPADRAPQDPAAAVTGSLAPRSSAPPMPVTQPTAPAATYWAGRVGERPSKMTVAALQELWDTHGDQSGVKVNVDGVSNWQPLATCGLIQVTQAQTPEVPQDLPPAVPEDAPPMVPAETSVPPAAAPAVTVEQMAATLFPDPAVLEAMPEEKRKKAQELIQRAWEATDGGTKRDLPPAIVDDLMQLIGD